MGYFVTIAEDHPLAKEAQMLRWAVYRQDFHGNRFTVGNEGTFRSKDGKEIQVWDLESEAAAMEAGRLIDESHYHPHKADYLAISYSAGRMHEMFARENIQIMGG